MIIIERYAVKLWILVCLGLVGCSVRKIEMFPEVEVINCMQVSFA